ncbi:MAG: hypothetical protein LAO20_22835, partial [Acidobacteriia bacterium]|nr:hypothetical protein [Terriglobia bacterium]
GSSRTVTRSGIVHPSSGVLLLNISLAHLMIITNNKTRMCSRVFQQSLVVLEQAAEIKADLLNQRVNIGPNHGVPDGI